MKLYLQITKFIVKSWVSKIGSAPNNLILGPRIPGALLGTRAERKRALGCLALINSLGPEVIHITNIMHMVHSTRTAQGDRQYRYVRVRERWKRLVNCRNDYHMPLTKTIETFMKELISFFSHIT